MKYDYDIKNECFVREDKLGKKFHINITEAKRIVTMRDLGNSIGMICAKIQFHSNKVSESTVINFLRNVDEGNIIVDGDYPAPKEVLEDLTVSDRISNLEERVSVLEGYMTPCECEHNISFKDKVKSWF